MVIFPLPNKEVLFTVLIFVPETKGSWKCASPVTERFERSLESDAEEETRRPIESIERKIAFSGE